MDCINRNTKQVAFSVGDASHYTSDWIKIPRELANQLGSLPTKYIVIENSVPRAMTTAERLAFDVVTPPIVNRYNPKSKTQIINELSLAIDPVLPVAEVTIPGVPGAPSPMGDDRVIPAIPGDSAEVLAEKQARGLRFNTGLQANQFFLLRLESNDYAAARAEAQKLVAGGVITQEDYLLLDSILPLTR